MFWRWNATQENFPEEGKPSLREIQMLATEVVRVLRMNFQADRMTCMKLIRLESMGVH